MASNTKQPKKLVSFRLPQADLDVLDALAERMTRDNGNNVVQYTRTDVLRLAIARLAEDSTPRERTPRKRS